jgi:HlyD family secretion protein
MDITRSESFKRVRQFRYVVLGAAAVAATLLVTYALTRLKPAAPNVARAAVNIDTVKRGPLVRQVRGTGALVSENIRSVFATAEGRVERIYVQPGAEVEPATVLLELVNPMLEQAALDAESQAAAAESDFSTLSVRLESELMAQEAVTANVQGEYDQARILLDALAAAPQGTTSLDNDVKNSPEVALKLTTVKVKGLANRLRIERRRLELSRRSRQTQLASQQARVAQLRRLAQARRTQVNALKVRANTFGVIQQLTVESGQQVTPLSNLARIADPTALRAELRIPDALARDVAAGQPATIDMRPGTIKGHVVRVDPAAQGGTVKVSVALDGELPRGARPDLGVDGKIDLERLDDALFVGLPGFSQEQGAVSLFRLEPGGRTAVRVKVELGRRSADAVEVLQGLREGDQVILSDTSDWDGYDRISID